MARSNSINHDLAVALSPVVFARSLGIEPDSWQSEVLRTDSKRIILNCARQTGKSSIVAILALHHALCQDKSMVLIISHTLQQAAETFRKCRDYYRQIAQPVLSITESVHRLELQNGSRIVTLTGQRPESIRGFSNVSLLIIDEAARVPDESYHAARPMVAVSDGRVILLSTPLGRRGFFGTLGRIRQIGLRSKLTPTNVRVLPRLFLGRRSKRSRIGSFGRNISISSRKSFRRSLDLKTSRRHLIIRSSPYWILT